MSPGVHKLFFGITFPILINPWSLYTFWFPGTLISVPQKSWALVTHHDTNFLWLNLHVGSSKRRTEKRKRIECIHPLKIAVPVGPCSHHCCYEKLSFLLLDPELEGFISRSLSVWCLVLYLGLFESSLGYTGVLGVGGGIANSLSVQWYFKFEE